MSTTLNIRPLTSELQKSAIEEINERPEYLASDVEALRTWINQQPYLKARTDDQFLVGFLRGCKHSLERAKTKIDKFYTFRTKYPESFRCSDIENCLSLNSMGPFNDNGPRIGIFRWGAFPPDKLLFSDVIAYSQVMQEIVIREDDHAIINGVIYIADWSDVKPQIFLQATPAYCKLITEWYVQALPMRMKAVHFINTPALFEPIFNIIKPVLAKKLQERVYVHGKDYEALYNHIPREFLPKEYGGENGSMMDNGWNDRILSYRDYIKEEVDYGTNEKLRPGKPNDSENMFGIDGSFRKINVD